MSRSLKEISAKYKYWIIMLCSILVLILIIALITVYSTLGRTLIEFRIHQNKEIIRLSSFAEPPQFAIWLEDPESHRVKTVFVTSRVGRGDWEGKANVPVALPKWFEIFRGQNSAYEVVEDEAFSAVTGATPKDDYFAVRVEVKPGSTWNCWIEMNLAGDFNDSYPEFNRETLEEDEFSCGQPALLFKATVNAAEGVKAVPVLEAQSVWADGHNSVVPVDSTITTARRVFDDMQITVVRPKPKLIDKTKISEQ